MSGGHEVCKWPIARPLRKSGHVCIGPARYDSLYLEEFVPPKRSDYPPPKTGGGWHNASSRRKYIPSPFKLDKSLYSVEFSRIKVPGQSDFQGLQKRVDPWLPKFPGEPEKKKDRCGIEVERDGPDGPPDFEDTLHARGRCCHADHQRYKLKAENPLRYPFSKYDPAFVDYDRPLTPPKVFVAPYPKKVTEDDVRNNPPKGWKGTKGFFTPEPHGHSSESGLGPFINFKDKLMAITGGTGFFREGKGVVDLHNLTPSKFFYTFTLSSVCVESYPDAHACRRGFSLPNYHD